MGWGLKGWGKTFRPLGWAFNFRIGNNPHVTILGFKFGPSRGRRR
jgi:hypothetical protein